VNGFVENLSTRLGTTSTCNAIADLHTSQITRVHAKSSQSAFTSRFLVTDLNNGDSSDSLVTLLPSNTSQLVIPLNYSAMFSQPPLQKSAQLIAPTVLVIISRRGPRRKHRSSIVAFVSVAAGTCLPSCFPETGCVTPFIKNMLPYRRALFRDRYTATGLHTTL
jgi:hypothetical protein